MRVEQTVITGAGRRTCTVGRPEDNYTSQTGAQNLLMRTTWLTAAEFKSLGRS